MWCHQQMRQPSQPHGLPAPPVPSHASATLDPSSLREYRCPIHTGQPVQRQEVIRLGALVIRRWYSASHSYPPLQQLLLRRLCPTLPSPTLLALTAVGLVQGREIVPGSRCQAPSMHRGPLGISPRDHRIGVAAVPCIRLGLRRRCTHCLSHGQVDRQHQRESQRLARPAMNEELAVLERQAITVAPPAEVRHLQLREPWRARDAKPLGPAHYTARSFPSTRLVRLWLMLLQRQRLSTPVMLQTQARC